MLPYLLGDLMHPYLGEGGFFVFAYRIADLDMQNWTGSIIQEHLCQLEVEAPNNPRRGDEGHQ